MFRYAKWACNTVISQALASFVSYIVIHDHKSRRFIRDRIRTTRTTGPEETAASSRERASMGRETDEPTDGPTERQPRRSGAGGGGV